MIRRFSGRLWRFGRRRRPCVGARGPRRHRFEHRRFCACAVAADFGADDGSLDFSRCRDVAASDRRASAPGIAVGHDRRRGALGGRAGRAASGRVSARQAPARWPQVEPAVARPAPRSAEACRGELRPAEAPRPARSSRSPRNRAHRQKSPPPPPQHTQRPPAPSRPSDPQREPSLHFSSDLDSAKRKNLRRNHPMFSGLRLFVPASLFAEHRLLAARRALTLAETGWHTTPWVRIQ